MTTLFVIGSNSFSGASFVDFSLSMGARVVGISRSAEPISAFLPYKWHGNSGSATSFDFRRLDLNFDTSAISSLLHEFRPEYVVNFAAQSMVGESWTSPEDWFLTNTVSTVKLHNGLRKCEFLKRYVHISTPEVYGNCSGFVNESAPFSPSTPYAVSRAAAEMSLTTFRQAYDFPFVTTRAANVYGAGQQLYRIIPRTILSILLGRKLQLHGGGVSTRSFIHVSDVSEATWRIMLNGRDGDAYHISNDHVFSIRELVEKICRKLSVSFEDHVEMVGDRMGKDSAYHLDSSKLRQELGWRDQINLDSGLDMCIDWVSNNLDSLRALPHDYIHKK